MFLAHKNATRCISDPKQNGFSIKQKYASLQKYIKIRDDDFKTMIVNYSVNDCQFEDKLLFLAHKNATRCISDPKQNGFMPFASKL